MKKICFLFLLQSLIFNLQSSHAQGGIWTWISGANVANAAGVFGTQGVPSVNNRPPAAYEAAEWKDKQGNFWIYGVWNVVAASYYSDLWKFNPLTKEWTWVKGSGLANQPPFYGTKGVANASNTPGMRGWAAVTWVDSSGALWLFGGGASPALGRCNDLWKYDIGTNEWTWVNGSNAFNGKGIHGTKGVASALNIPGSRCETSSAWTDESNNLWLFGGSGYDENDTAGLLNDLMKYNISTDEWTWMKGSATHGSIGNYGTLGVADTSNEPEARLTYTKWKDAQCNFWLMGGTNYTQSKYLNDVWKYDITSNEWTWMSGTSVLSDPGKYNAACVFDTINLPVSRFEQRSSVTDNCGRFWLFGGGDQLGVYNDLWVFDPQQLKWNWVSGTNVRDQAGSYGTLGVPSPSNMPSSRKGGVAWWGNDNKFYTFGGFTGNNSFSDVWVFNPDTNCVTSSSCSTITCNAVVLPPVADFQSTQTTICANDCINFTNLSTNATSWQWSFAGAQDSTSAVQNPQSVCYSIAGIYNVTLIASNSAGSDSVTFSSYIHVITAPPAPVITQHNDALYCSTDPTYTSYQWFFNNTLIPGATDTVLIVTLSGNYNLQVANENGCQTATGINIILGIQNYTNDNLLSLSPNPAGNKLAVTGRQLAGKKVTLEIYDMLGEKVSQLPTVNCQLPTVIDVSSLSAGIYFVQVADDSGRWVARFVKE